MNIFILDKNPKESAKYHCNKHVVKMILESAQMLSSVLRIKQGKEEIVLVLTKNGYKTKKWFSLPSDDIDRSGDIPILKDYKVYAVTHRNHPCTIWAGESQENYNWLKELAYYLNEEYKSRFNHTINHKSYDVIANLPSMPLPNKGLTPFAQAMPDECKDEDAVSAYRKYYMLHKRDICTWKTEQPKWFK